MAIPVIKQYSSTASVLKGTNKVVACSKADWLGVREGQNVILGDDLNFYQIVHTEKFFFIKDVEAVAEDELEIKENTNIRLSIDDDIVFTHKEYETIEIKNIQSPGAGYTAGDLLKPDGGTCRYNSFDEIDIPTLLKVEEVDDAGAITSLSVEVKGVYSKPPKDLSDLLGGSGAGAIVKIETQLLEDRSMEERSIKDVYFHGETTRIKLNHPLPPRAYQGKISVSKWQLTLHMNYAGESRFNAPYRIIKDYTPHCSLPLLSDDMKNASYILYNRSMNVLDEKIKEQAGQIEELKNKLEELSGSLPPAD